MARQTTKLSQQMLDEASAWFTEFTAGGLDAVAQAEFNSWLRRSPEHVQAYLQIAAFWEDADLLKASAREDLDCLIARARQETNVYPLELSARADGVEVGGPVEPYLTSVRGIRLPTTANAVQADTPLFPGSPEAPENAVSEAAPVPSETHASPKNSFRGPNRSFLALAALVALLLVAGTWIYGQRGIYSTEVGEQRSITLDDGSAIELNAKSRLKVRLNKSQRSVELLAGQALFQVAKDPNRPFVVQSGETRVRAVGTQFDVYRKRDGTVITVVEGRIAVAGTHARSASPDVQARPSEPAVTPRDRDEILLEAGEQLVVGTGTAAPVVPPERKPHRTNVAAAIAWTQKKLVFDGAPLREVVEEFNRYNRRQLVIRDPSLLEFHVSGVFPSTDSARMLDVLRRRFGVILEESGDRIEILAAADGASAIDRH